MKGKNSNKGSTSGSSIKSASGRNSGRGARTTSSKNERPTPINSFRNRSTAIEDLDRIMREMDNE